MQPQGSQYDHGFYRASFAGGFTLIEVILTVSILLAIGSGSVYLSTLVLQRNDVVTARDAVVSSVRAARERALLHTADSSWGVHVGDGVVTVFAGSSYASRSTARDIDTPFADTLTIEGDTEYVFSPLSGRVDEVGDITVRAGTVASSTISIDSYGTPTRT